MREICKTNILVIDKLLSKIQTGNEYYARRLEKATTDSERNEVRAKQDKRIKRAEQMYEILEPLLVDMPYKIKETRRIQVHALHVLNERKKITSYEKVMANIAITLGYDHNEIKHILGIHINQLKRFRTDKPMRTYLESLEWLKRCPNPDCGIMIADVLDDLITISQEPDESPPLTSEDIDPEPLLITGYQAELAKAHHTIKQLKHELKYAKKK